MLEEPILKSYGKFWFQMFSKVNYGFGLCCQLHPKESGGLRWWLELDLWKVIVSVGWGDEEMWVVDDELNTPVMEK